MAHNQKVDIDLLSDFGDLLAGISHPQPRRRREVHGFQPLHAFRKDRLIICELLVHRDHDASFQGGDAGGSLYNGQQEDFRATNLRDLGTLPQRASSFDRAVIGEKNFLIHEEPPRVRRELVSVSRKPLAERLARPSSSLPAPRAEFGSSLGTHRRVVIVGTDLRFQGLF